METTIDRVITENGGTAEMKKVLIRECSTRIEGLTADQVNLALFNLLALGKVQGISCFFPFLSKGDGLSYLDKYFQNTVFFGKEIDCGYLIDEDELSNAKGILDTYTQMLLLGKDTKYNIFIVPYTFLAGKLPTIAIIIPQGEESSEIEQDIQESSKILHQIKEYSLSIINNPSISERIAHYWKSFEETYPYTEITQYERSLFNIVVSDFFNGKLSIDEIFDKLNPIIRYTRMLLKHLFIHNGVDHVIDRRGNLSLQERVNYVKTQDLSDVGISALVEIERRLALGEDVIGLLPSLTSPHLEYFKPLNELNESGKPIDFSIIQKSFACLRTVSGCSHGCVHCDIAPNNDVTSMPFHRILQLLEKFSEGNNSQLLTEEHLERSSGSKSSDIALYYDSDCLDYYDPVYGADISDVIGAILSKFPKQKIHITTRGWYAGDGIAPEAIRKLALLEENEKERLNFRVSIDLYDVKHGDLAGYIERIVKLLDGLSSFGKINTACTGDMLNTQIRNVYKIISQLTKAGIPFIDKVFYNVSGQKGRAAKTFQLVDKDIPDDWDGKKLPTQSSWDVADCMGGYHLTAGGQLLEKTFILGRDRNKEQAHQFSSVGSLWKEGEGYRGLAPKKIKREKRFPINIDRKGFYTSKSFNLFQK